MPGQHVILDARFGSVEVETRRQRHGSDKAARLALHWLEPPGCISGRPGPVNGYLEGGRTPLQLWVSILRAEAGTGMGQASEATIVKESAQGRSVNG